MQAPTKHTNRLIHATSPYLLQHAHNPVDWYEWGPEALRRARDEDKPIFLSIGYSACHWCHVMERESFEDEGTAALLNEHFVCIKVDREERPDLDDIYMTATQALTGAGGWPMSVWLTPDLKPFYAGTYFPPTARYGRPGFRDVLRFLADVWRDDRPKVLTQAEEVTRAVRSLAVVEAGAEQAPYELVVKAATDLARCFDPVKGGMASGGSNKFPPSMAIDLMLRVHHRLLTSPDKTTRPMRELLELVELTLDRMARGGIYDQLGGGFARYSTDPDWLVPHFEKMLYDQALITDIYLKAYQATGKTQYARVARETFDYVLADLQDAEGGFYSSRDADSEGEEGKFYTWLRAEITSVLGDEDAELFCAYYEVTEDGNWEGKNILHVPRPLEVVAKLCKVSPLQLEERIASARRKVFAAREKRVKPHLDDKILASWNGLMIGSLARASCILEEPRYAEAACRAAEFVLARMVCDGRLHRVYRQGKLRVPAYLDDHAFMIEALLNLYEASFDARWLDRAASLNEQVIARFRDEAGGFYFTADDGERLVVRNKDANDGAIPSGNSVQLMNLLRLAALLDRPDLAAEGEKLIRVFSNQLRENPYRSERMLSALDFYHRRPLDILFVARRGCETRLAPLRRVVWRTYMPNTVVAGLLGDGPDSSATAAKVPVLAGKEALPSGIAAYVCQDGACLPPVDDPDELATQIRR